MSWFVLVLSGVLEAVWATALGKTQGFTRLVPSVVFSIAILASMAGLAYAMRTLPVGTAYAVWTGIGAAGTAVVGMLFLRDPVTTVRLLSILLIIAGVVGLNLSSSSAH
jgi:quaternary ammonium compound-resistance protein SugE